MAQWVIDNKTTYNIQGVLAAGDIVLTSDAASWALANQALDLLEGAGIPFYCGLGNHDYAGDANDRNSTLYNTHYGPSYYTGKLWFTGGFFEEGKADNFYALRTIAGINYLIINLDFGPRQVALDWAATILQTYPSYYAIINTHAYLYNDGTRFGTGDTYNPHDIITSGSVHDGEEMWTELVKLYPNIRQVWSGHSDGFNRQISTGDYGNTVNEILDAHGTVDGHFVLAEFKPSAGTVKVTKIIGSTGEVTATLYNLSY